MLRRNYRPGREMGRKWKEAPLQLMIGIGETNPPDFRMEPGARRWLAECAKMLRDSRPVVSEGLASGWKDRCRSSSSIGYDDAAECSMYSECLCDSR